MAERDYYENYPFLYDNETRKPLVDKDGIVYSVRDLKDTLKTLFSDAPTKKRNKLLSIFRRNQRVSYRTFENGHTRVERISPVHIQNDFFQPGLTILEIGCGRGDSLHQLAIQYPETRFIGIDRALTPVHTNLQNRDNLIFATYDWNDLTLAPKSIDRIMLPFSQLYHNWNSPQAAFHINKISKIGTLLRGNYNVFEPIGWNYGERMSQMGWRVWDYSEDFLIIAQKVKDVDLSLSEVQRIFSSSEGI